MEIKTKYDIGDEVKFYWWGIETKGKISNIRLSVDNRFNIDTEYNIDFNESNFDWFDENRIIGKD